MVTRIVGFSRCANGCSGGAIAKAAKRPQPLLRQLPLRTAVVVATNVPAATRRWVATESASAAAAAAATVNVKSSNRLDRHWKTRFAFSTSGGRFPLHLPQRRCMMMMMGGNYSRMLDLGGAPSSSTSVFDRTTTITNLNKNCHLQAVIFDFSLLCHTTTSTALPPPQQQEHQNDENSTTTTTAVAPLLHQNQNRGTNYCQPDVEKIQQVADLLKVDWSAATGIKDKSLDGRKSQNDDVDTDEVSWSRLLFNTKTADSKKDGNASATTTRPIPPQHPSAKHSDNNDNYNKSGQDDIRSKYAAKLQRARFGGGTVPAGPLKEDAAQKYRGDAADHFAARARVTTAATTTTNNNNNGGSSWMAATGTGALLTYLRQRNMKLALAATPGVVKMGASSNNCASTSTTASTTTTTLNESQRIENFCNQVRDKVKFDAVSQGSYTTAEQLVAATVAQLLGTSTTTATTITPDRCLWVSDRDDCLRAAKEAGLLTARIRPGNARRGNVTAHYTVHAVPDVQTVINEINGISFNTVLLQQQQQQR